MDRPNFGLQKISLMFKELQYLKIDSNCDNKTLTITDLNIF